MDMVLTYGSSSVQTASVCPLVDLRHHSCFQHVSSLCYTRLADRAQIDSYVLMELQSESAIMQQITIIDKSSHLSSLAPPSNIS
jgi:hypothetical protein